MFIYMNYKMLASQPSDLHTNDTSTTLTLKWVVIIDPTITNACVPAFIFTNGFYPSPNTYNLLASRPHNYNLLASSLNCLLPSAAFTEPAPGTLRLTAQRQN